MQLQTLLADFVTELGNPLSDHLEITGIASDTRKLKSGDMFVALQGEHGNSLVRFAKQAIEKGASAIIYDSNLSEFEQAMPADQCPIIPVQNLSLHLGAIAARFYDYPTDKLDIIGITGTNGKTSCSQFLGQLLNQCGIIGTLGWGDWGNLQMTGYTTPDALMTQAILSECVERKYQTLAMEVSSHGIAEHRIGGVNFKGAVLTNISRDHLDYHGTMEAYIATKTKLFTRPELQFAVINLDDPLAQVFTEVISKKTQILGYSSHSSPKVRADIKLLRADKIRHLPDGLSFDLIWRNQTQAVQVPLYGAFNVENILAVTSVMLALGFDLPAIAKKLCHLRTVSGRMERFGNQDSALIFVDYAHTPDALEKALKSARQHCTQKLWVVFGCGGDRDAGKRPEMGRFAEELADQVIITDDNPRSESPEKIVQDILSGLKAKPYKIIHDRKEAIELAIRQASNQDCVVIAGKGHEQYQEYADQILPFSDSSVVREALSEQVTV